MPCWGVSQRPQGRHQHESGRPRHHTQPGRVRSLRPSGGYDEGAEQLDDEEQSPDLRHILSNAWLLAYRMTR